MRVELPGDRRHGGLVDESHAFVYPAQLDQACTLQLKPERVDRTVLQPRTDLLCELRLAKGLLEVAGQAVGHAGQRDGLPSVGGALADRPVEESLRPCQPSFANGGLQPVEVIQRELEGHLGGLTPVALLQVRGVGSLPCLDGGVGIPREPRRLREDGEVRGDERALGVRSAKRAEGFVPGVTPVRVATCLKAILKRLTHPGLLSAPALSHPRSISTGADRCRPVKAAMTGTVDQLRPVGETVG